MGRLTGWMLFRIPGACVALLPVLWALALFVFRLDGRYDTSNWAGLWPWALTMLFGGCFWMAIPDAFERKDRTR